MAHRDISLSDARRQSTAETPAFVWDSGAQKLTPIWPEGHPEYQQNAETIAAALRRWNGRTK
jgi:hypothetical protein